MTVNVVTGNIFESDCDIITDANNSIGIAGAGLALAFAKRYPDLTQNYNRICKEVQQENIDMGEDVILLPPSIFSKDLYDNFDFAVCKFPTMIYPGEKTKEENIETNLEILKEFLTTTQYKSIALPALGCGIGMYSFEKLEEQVRKYFDDGCITVYLYRPI